MWFLFLLTVLNAVADESGWAYPLRFDVGSITFSLFLILLAAGLVLSLLSWGKRDEVVADRLHPLFVWTLVLMGLGTAAGCIGWFMNGYGFHKFLGISIRDHIALPVSMFVGYRLVRSWRGAAWFPHAMVAGGVGVAVCILVYFAARADVVHASGNYDTARATVFCSTYAALAGGLLVYSFTSGNHFMPVVVAIVCACVALLGHCATLSRADWIVTALAVITAYWVMPRARRRGRGVLLAVMLVGLFAALWCGAYVASAATGRDLFMTMQARLQSLLPGDDDSFQRKAWDSRLPGASKELKLYASNILTGAGFGGQEDVATREGLANSEFHHNAWTDTMARSGTFGLLGALAAIVGCAVVGRRMVRDETDRTTMLIGALGAIAGVCFGALGLMTGSFNSLRGGICLGVICGVVFKCRAMQLTALAQARAAWPAGEESEQAPEAPHETPAEFMEHSQAGGYYY